MKKITLTALIFLFAFPSFSQPTIQWQRCHGGANLERASCVQQTIDGGYIVSGYSNSNDSDVTGHHGTLSTFDYWVTKLDINGGIQWQKSLGGSINDYARSIQQISDGGYILSGQSYSSDGDINNHHGSTTKSDYWVIKLDSGGSIQWQKSYGGTEDDVSTSVQQTADGGFIVTGYSASNDGDVTGNHGMADYWVIKLNGSGTILWQKCFGGTAPDSAKYIRQTSDGGYVIVGTTFSNDIQVTNNYGLSDYWVVKIDNMGNMQWQKNYGGSSNELASSIQQTSDGGYIVTGSSASNDNDVTGHHDGININFDYWIVKLNGMGNILWQKSLGGTDNSSSIVHDMANSAHQTIDGGYIVAGYSSSVDGDVTDHIGMNDYWILKLDSAGETEWKKSYGGTDNDEAYSIKQTSDFGYVIAGSSWSFDGDVTANHGADFWIVKLAPYAAIEENNAAQINIFPNPAISEFTIANAELKIKEIEIYSSFGEKIYLDKYGLGNHPRSVTIGIADFPPGIYFITIIDQGGNKMTRKVVKL